MFDDASPSVIEVLRKDEGLIDLAATALLIAEYLTTAFDKQHYLDRLARMATTVGPKVAAARSDQEVIEALNDFLFGQLRLSGNTDDYYDPDNSFLNKVMDTRKGIPISLGVLYIEVGRRLHLPLWGIGTPGHFIVGYGPEASPLLIDVFNRGRILTEDDCLELCRVPLEERDSFRNQFIRPVSKKQILYRILLNLKYIYLDQQTWASALKTVTLMMALRPNRVTDLRDRGLLYARLNRLHDAVADLQRYLFLVPKSTETKVLKARLEAMETDLARLN